MNDPMLERIADAIFGSNGRGLVARTAVIEEAVQDLRTMVSELAERFSAVERQFIENRDGLDAEQRRRLFGEVRGHLEDEDAHLSVGDRENVRRMSGLLLMVGTATGRAAVQVLQTVLMAAIFALLVANGMRIDTTLGR